MKDEEKTKKQLIEELDKARTYIRELELNRNIFWEMDENIYEAFWASAPNNGRFYYLSSAFDKIWGRSRKEFYATPSRWMETIHPDDRELVQNNLQKQLNGTKTLMIYRIVRPDGEVRFIEDRTYPLQNEKGEVYRLVGIASDVTEQKEFEEQLELQSLVLDQIQDRVTVTDLDGNITYANEAEVQSLGHSKEELIGKNVRVYGDDPARGATQEEIIRKTLSEGFWRGTVINYSTKGEEVVLDSRTQIVVDNKGKPIALCSISLCQDSFRH